MTSAQEYNWTHRTTICYIQYEQRISFHVSVPRHFQMNAINKADFGRPSCQHGFAFDRERHASGMIKIKQPLKQRDAIFNLAILTSR